MVLEGRLIIKCALSVNQVTLNHLVVLYMNLKPLFPSHPNDSLAGGNLEVSYHGVQLINVF